MLSARTGCRAQVTPADSMLTDYAIRMTHVTFFHFKRIDRLTGQYWTCSPGNPCPFSVDPTGGEVGCDVCFSSSITTSSD